MADIEVRLNADGVGAIVLNRPAKRNALSRAMCIEIAEGVSSLGSDPACTGIVLSAAGATFSAGADMSEPALDTPATWHWDMSETVRMYREIAGCPVPVVAAVEGLTVGLGVGLLAVSTYVVASDQAEFWFPEVGQGFFPYGAVEGLARRVAPETVVRWALGTERISAAEAAAERLITQLVLAGSAHDVARDLCLALGRPGRPLVAEALRYLRACHDARRVAAIEQWCGERMTADVLKRRAAAPAETI